MAETKVKRYGKYLIVDHLVNGGMAEIFRARYLAESADKIVAIKMIQPQFSRDPQFKKMFMDEIQVSFGLIHPNIAQTYEYGMQEERLFVAMEYVDGKNLKEFLDRLKQRKFVFPVEISIYLASQVCQALSYAHNFTDKLSGKKANIIHRDISPHNIMLTYDGAVKVIDFGIAKAETNSDSTRAGTIKGKLSYLAPEYLEGLPLDHRYDQFAVGITLWELLCSRKLFDAPNDLACLKKIQACDVPPPSSINPNVSKELDQIVLKALSKDRNLRYENMDQFNRALVKYLYANYPDFNATDLGYFAGELYKDEIAQDRKKLIEFGKIDIAPYLKQIQNDGGKTSSPVDENGKITPKRMELEFGMEESDLKDATKTIKLDNKTRQKIAATRRSHGEQMGGNAGDASTMGNTSSTSMGASSTTRTRYKKKKFDSNPIVLIVVIALLGGFAYLKRDMLAKMTGIKLSSYLNKEKKPATTDGKVAGKIQHDDTQIDIGLQGKVTLSGVDPYMDIYIDGKLTTYKGLGMRLPYGSHELKIVKENYKKFIYNFILDSGNPIESISIPALELQRYGALTTSRNFSPGNQLLFEIDGESVTIGLPLTSYRLPIGKYQATIYNPTLGIKEKSVNFSIEENKNTVLE